MIAVENFLFILVLRFYLIELFFLLSILCWFYHKFESSSQFVTDAKCKSFLIFVSRIRWCVGAIIFSLFSEKWDVWLFDHIECLYIFIAGYLIWIRLFMVETLCHSWNFRKFRHLMFLGFDFCCILCIRYRNILKRISWLNRLNLIDRLRRRLDDLISFH